MIVNDHKLPQHYLKTLFKVVIHCAIKTFLLLSCIGCSVKTYVLHRFWYQRLLSYNFSDDWTWIVSALRKQVKRDFDIEVHMDWCTVTKEKWWRWFIVKMSWSIPGVERILVIGWCSKPNKSNVVDFQQIKFYFFLVKFPTDYWSQFNKKISHRNKETQVYRLKKGITILGFVLGPRTSLIF